MGSETIAEYVDADLRNQATKEQIKFLNEHKELWRLQLCVLKRKAETQMTSHAARVAQLNLQFRKGEIDSTELMEGLQSEKVWKTGANRFIQEIESKLAMIKYDGNSE